MISSHHFTIGSAHAVKGPSVDCWLFDPPYNVGFRYNAVRDDLAWSDYEALIAGSCANMAAHTENGHLWMVNYPVQSARLLPVIESQGWTLHQWLTWTYPSNVGHSKARFTKASRAILWFTRGDPFINIRATTQPFKNPNDRRIKALIASGREGTAHYDYWPINLRKNVSKGYRGWANQLPVELVSRIVETSTMKGGVVGDLMAGSGTLLEVAAPLGRQVWLNDIDPEAIPLWEGILNE